MAKTIYINSSHTHTSELVPYEKTVTVHEHRAPTDESVKLLNEFQQKAIENIITQVQIDTNEVKGMFIVLSCEPDFLHMRYVYRFILNGKEYKGEFKIESLEYRLSVDNYNYEKLMHLFYEKLAQSIAIELLNANTEILKTML
mgnify:CR=1 FL=1